MDPAQSVPHFPTSHDDRATGCEIFARIDARDTRTSAH